MLKQILSAFFVFSAMSSVAFADEPEIRLFLEPKVGFGTAAVKYKSGSVNSDTTGASTVFVSTVVGWTANDLYFGADLRYDNALTAVDSGGSKDSLAVYTLGVGLGYTLEYVPLRWYASFDLQQSAASKGSSVETGGTRFGLSYYISEKFLINFDLSEPYFKSTSSSGDQVRATIYGLSLSVPMDFARETTPWRERRGYVSDVKPDSALEKMDISSELKSSSNSSADSDADFGDDLDENKAEASVDELNFNDEDTSTSDPAETPAAEEALESEDELSL